MKPDFPRLIPIWFLPTVILAILLLIQCGCRTGGVKLNPNSAGKILAAKSPKQINEETKAKREESQKFKPLAPIPIIPPARTQTDAARSNPVIPKPQSAKANPVASDPKASGKSTSFSPTVSTNLSTKLPPIKTEKLPLKIVEGGCVVITDNSGKPEGWCGTKQANETAPCKEAFAKTNWILLFSLFMMLFTGALILWVAYDVIKDIFYMRKQGTPMKDHLDNLKKPAKGTKTSRKKAIAKKRVAKKKNPKKKD